MRRVTGSGDQRGSANIINSLNLPISDSNFHLYLRTFWICTPTDLMFLAGLTPVVLFLGLRESSRPHSCSCLKLNLTQKQQQQPPRTILHFHFVVCFGSNISTQGAIISSRERSQELYLSSCSVLCSLSFYFVCLGLGFFVVVVVVGSSIIEHIPLNLSFTFHLLHTIVHLFECCCIISWFIFSFPKTKYFRAFRTFLFLLFLSY